MDGMCDYVRVCVFYNEIDHLVCWLVIVYNIFFILFAFVLCSERSTCSTDRVLVTVSSYMSIRVDEYFPCV